MFNTSEDLYFRFTYNSSPAIFTLFVIVHNSFTPAWNCGFYDIYDAEFFILLMSQIRDISDFITKTILSILSITNQE
jgi:hypothetical protein